MEKKYPGTYKRHLVRPIVRSNAVEKLIRKKGSISHKPGMPPTKRYETLLIHKVPDGMYNRMYIEEVTKINFVNVTDCISYRPDLLRSDGIPSMDPLPCPSPLSASPKVSTPPGKARYRSKPRHRRANSKGSHSEFPGLLKPIAGPLEDTQSLQEQQFHHHHHHHHLPPTEGPFLPLKGREEAVVNCANNLRYFGPAAALRSPQTDHLQRRVSGSSPDLISTAVDADTRQRTSSTSSNPVPGAGAGSLCPCCQAHPFPGCLHCQETPPASNHPELSHYSLLNTQESAPTSLVVPGKDLASDGKATKKAEPQEQEACQHSHALPSALPRTLRPLRKVSTAGGLESVCTVFLLGERWVINSCNCFSRRAAMSHLRRRRGRLIVKWSFQGDRGKIQFDTLTVTVL